MPVAECGVHNAVVDGKQCKAIDVPILGCASVWLRVQKEAEAWITLVGRLIADPIQRNHRINQAYAQLWLADKRFQWAGLAAFASKQVGCGLLHAAGNIEQAQEEMRQNRARIDIMNSGDGAAIDTAPSAIGGSSAYMFQQLALGNTLLLYDDLAMRRALDANQFSWATNFPTGVAAEVQLTLSSECRKKSGAATVWFPKNKTARLYDRDQAWFSYSMQRTASTSYFMVMSEPALKNRFRKLLRAAANEISLYRGAFNHRRCGGEIFSHA